MSNLMCLAVRQPWAWAIFNAGKDIENRDWQMRFRGPIAILASKGMTQAEYDEGCYFISRKEPRIVIPSYDAMVRGQILGTVEVAGCGQYHDNKWFVGAYGILLRNPVKLGTPVPASGKLGLFPLEDSIEAEVWKQHAKSLQTMPVAN